MLHFLVLSVENFLLAVGYAEASALLLNWSQVA
jgi:hypothetical protein